MQEPVNEPKKRYPALDGYRAVALLLVFAHHYASSSSAPALGIPIYGWIGVDLFFVLSGFLITGILFDSQNRQGRVKTFYMRRILRIFPLYYGVMLLIFLCGSAIHTHWVWQQALWPLHLGNYSRFLGHPPPSILATDMILKDGRPYLLYGHFWSLCIEEQFYLLWPLIVFKVKDRRKLIQLCLVVLVLSPIARIAAAEFVPGWLLARELIYRSLPFRMDALLAGALLALLLRGPERKWLTRWRIPIGLVGVVAVFVIFGVQHAVHHLSLPPGMPGDPLALVGFGYTFLDLGAAAMLTFLLDDNSIVVKGMSWAPLRNLGVISYGCYVFHDLFHPYIMDFSIWHSSHHALRLNIILGFVQMIGLATLSYFVYERFFLRLKSKFQNEVHKTPGTTVKV